MEMGYTAGVDGHTPVKTLPSRIPLEMRAVIIITKRSPIEQIQNNEAQRFMTRWAEIEYKYDHIELILPAIIAKYGSTIDQWSLLF